MAMSSKDNQPDWHKIAEKFDMWLPYIKPVGDDLISVLNAQPGDKVLDIASGTGEPALSLARQMGDRIEIVGVDAAEGMINVAQAKVINEGLNNIRFLTMPAEKLEFEDNRFDKLLCRFGVMLFNDPLAGAKEIYRVLKPEASFALAVWAEAENMPTMNWAYQVLKDKIPEEIHPPIKKVTSLGESGVIEALLANAGFNQVKVERQTFYYEFDSFNDYWDIVEASDIMKVQFDALNESQRSSLRDEVAIFAQQYNSNAGFYVPHDYLLVTGKK
jgi:ubiquinone/menaquinone biosynthesis C-methylase UbiE